jgi:hypothetical protein
MRSHSPPPRSTPRSVRPLPGEGVLPWGADSRIAGWAKGPNGRLLRVVTVRRNARLPTRTHDPFALGRDLHYRAGRWSMGGLRGHHRVALLILSSAI